MEVIRYAAIGRDHRCGLNPSASPIRSTGERIPYMAVMSTAAVPNRQIYCRSVAMIATWCVRIRSWRAVASTVTGGRQAWKRHCVELGLHFSKPTDECLVDKDIVRSGRFEGVE